MADEAADSMTTSSSLAEAHFYNRRKQWYGATDNEDSEVEDSPFPRIVIIDGPVGQKGILRFSAFTGLIAAAALLSICAFLVVGIKDGPFLRAEDGRQRSDIPYQDHHHHHHSHNDTTPTPTLLSVFEKDGSKLVDALQNPVYKLLDEALQNVKHVPRFGMSNTVAELHTDRREVDFGQPLTVSWPYTLGVEYNDVIAMYCPAYEADPLKYKDALLIEQAVQVERPIRKLWGSGTEEWRIPAFPIIREESCEFRLWSREAVSASTGSSEFQSMKLAARSGPFTVTNALTLPTAIHLALTESPRKMIVQFTTGKVQGTSPVVLYSEKGSTDLQIRQAVGTSRTYTAADMCGAPANDTGPGKFIDPGMLHTITMADLKPDTEYSYRVGIKQNQDSWDSKDIIWSDSYTFQSPLDAGSNEEFSFIVYADQGIPAEGWVDGAEEVLRLIDREVDGKGIRAVHHVGDLTYSQGVGHIWDHWFHLIQPVAARVPLMVAVGNHEYDHTGGGQGEKDPSGVTSDGGYSPPWGNFRDDSSGECGVPLASRFSMPRTGNGVFWYSYNLGLTHVTVISSEHDLSASSTQYKWLENDLASVDRTRTPWLIVESHRPLYHAQIFIAASGIDENYNVATGMRRNFEHLLKKYSVDLFVTGHYHSYHRTCLGLYQGLCNNGGPVHITVGTAGAEILDTPLRPEMWTEAFLKTFGYGRVTVANESALHYEFVASEDGNELDEFWLHK